MIKEKNYDKFTHSIGLLRVCVLAYIACAASCSSVKFGVSNLENTGDARAVLALCYRAQKDNAAAAGGNTRNCDDIQAEAIRFVRYDICQGAYDKKTCVCNIYKICEKTKDEN